MPLYSYEAFSRDGKKVKGTLDAVSMQGVREHLSRQGLFPISIIPAYGASQSFRSRFFARAVSEKEKILFTRQLKILLRSGIPVLQSFELLIDQFEGSLHTILVAVKDDLKEGSSLWESLKKYPKVFETIYVQLVRAGEASGNLELVLDRLSTYLERRQATRKKISGALRKPFMQLGMAGLVTTGLVTFIVPQIAGNFSSGGKVLPWPTRFLMGVSSIITGHYILLISFIVVVVFTFKYWKSTPSGARSFDSLILRLPLVGFLSRTNAVVQFSYTLGMLLEGGVHLPDALDVVVKIIDNRLLADALREARDNIVKQGKIAQYLKQTKIFPPMSIYLIETGEQSGELATMLLTVARNYEEETNDLIDRLTGLLDPIMLITMALIVGFIVFAIALPIMKMNELAGI